MALATRFGRSRRLLQCFALPLLLLCLLFPQRAFADAWVENYELTIRLAHSGEKAHFVLRLDYRSYENKTSGFKYLGKNEVTDFIARDGEGNVLHSSVGRDSTGTVLVDFDLPQSKPQTVVLSFDQALDARYGWNERIAQVEWATKFKISVKAMKVHVEGRDLLDVEGFDCTDSSHGRACDRASTDGVVPVRVHTRGSGSLESLAPRALSPIVAMGLVVWLFIRRLVIIRRERGVLLSPILDVSENFVQRGYRAPPVIPPVKRMEPRLSRVDVRMLLWKGIALATLFATELVLSSFPSQLPIPQWAFWAGAWVVFTVAAGLAIEVTSLVIPLLVVGATAVLTFVPPELLVLWGMLAFFALGVGWAILSALGSSGGGGGSGCGSGSGCGGGGGGCGGGGGGGGCGG